MRSPTSTDHTDGFRELISDPTVNGLLEPPYLGQSDSTPRILKTDVCRRGVCAPRNTHPPLR